MKIVNVNKIETKRNKINVYDGPIDQVVDKNAGLLCPECELNELQFIEKQSGICYSGCFKTSCLEHYSCDECEEMFIDINSNDYKTNKAVIEYKKIN